MGMFDPDEDPDYIRMESQLDNIKKILKADFLNETLFGHVQMKSLLKILIKLFFTKES